VVVCDQVRTMSDSESLSAGVRVFMTEKEALWHEFEHGVSQQGSSSEGNPYAEIPSARVLSETGAGPSGRVTEEVDSDGDEVDSEETQIPATDAESDLESHPREGMLLRNPKSGIVPEDVMLWRYMYRIPPNVEIRVPSHHERVDWVVPGWTAVYELMLKDGMRFPIPRLIRDVCDHYEIAPSQLMPNAWRVLMSLESLGSRHGVDCELGEVLFSYYLKEHDVDKGRYKLIARVGRAPIVTCLRTNDRGWKDRYLFVRGDLVWGPRGTGGVPGHWKSTSKEFLFLSCKVD
jgi:Putative gypsy type transposon